MKFKQQLVSLAILAVVGSAAFAHSGETVKIALIDPQSGLMGPLGLNQLRSFQFFADTFSKSNAAGVKYEVVGFDNKLSPAESLNALKAAMDQGIRYIAQGNGSSVAGALIDAVKTEIDDAKRTAMIQEAFTIHAKEFGTIPLHDQVIPWAMKKNIDIKHQPNNRPVVERITIN